MTIWDGKPWRCLHCGRSIRDIRDHLPRCPALGRPKG